MATLNALMYDLSAGQQQLISDLLFDSSTRKLTLPGDLDLGANDLLNVGSFEPDALILPGATSPAQTAEGSVVWDTDNDVLTVGDGSGRQTMVDLAQAQTLTNKTLSSPVLDLPQINDTSDDHQYIFAVSELAADRTVTLPLLASGDEFIFAAHAKTLTNKTMDADSNTFSNFEHGAEVDNPSSGVHGVSGTLVGTSDTQTLLNKTLTSPILDLPQINDTSDTHQYIFAVNELVADRIVTLPLLGSGDEFVFKDHAVTLTNKSISGGSNTLSGILTSSLASTTGSDSAVATGTAGTSQNFAMWDANGDLVDSTKSASDLITTLASLTDVTITAGAAQDLVYRNAGDTAWVNLAKGTEGQFLTVTGGVLSWGVSGAGSMSSFGLVGDGGTPQTIVDSDVVSILTGNGLNSVVGATDTVTISPVADATGGANLSTCVDINANGLAIGVDDSTIEDNGSDRLRVKASGIGATELDATRNETLTGTIDLTGGTITVPTPSTDAEAATKAYVDSIAQGLDVHPACQAGSTQDISLEGTGATQNVAGGTSGNGQITFSTGPTILDGYSLVNDDRILVKDCGTGTAEISGCDTVADSSGSLNDTWFVFYTTSTLAYYVWYNVNSAGSDPAPSPPANAIYKGIEVAIPTNETAVNVAIATKTAIDLTVRKTGEPEFIDCTVVRGTNDLTITNTYGGVVTNIADTGGTGFAVAEDTPGTGFNPCMNGIWVRTAQNTWDRAADMDGTGIHPNSGDYSFIVSGTVYGTTGWSISSLNPLDIDPATGAEPVDWFQFSGAGTYTAKPTGGLNLDGTEFEVKIDATGGANLATVIKTGSNGTAIGVDDTSLEESAGGGVLRVKASGIGTTELDLAMTPTWTGLHTFSHSSGLATNVITERTGGSGVTVDSCLIKDGNVDKAHTLGTSWLNAGENLALGSILYIETDGDLNKADANASSTGYRAVVGVNASIVTTGNPVFMHIAGEYDPSQGPIPVKVVASLELAVGDSLYASSTGAGGVAGEATPNVSGFTAGDWVQKIGTVMNVSDYDAPGGWLAYVHLWPEEAILLA